jgi:glucokinase
LYSTFVIAKKNLMFEDPTTICAIGIDVGGSKIAAGVVTKTGEILFPCLMPTVAERGGEAVLQDVEALSQELMNKAERSGLRVAGIGLSVAELVDLRGNVTSGHTIKWSGLPVRQRLSNIAPTAIEADVRAAALAEAIHGMGRNYEIFLYLTVGTGISSCLVQNKQPYAGAYGNALVCASSPLTSRCAECGADNNFTLEDYASGPALALRYQPYSSEKMERAEQVIEAAERGDVQAIEIIRSAGSALGVTAALLVNVFDPEAIVVGGGLGLCNGPYWECFLSSTRERIWAEARRDLPIHHAAHADNGVIGAALSFWRKHNYQETKG